MIMLKILVMVYDVHINYYASVGEAMRHTVVVMCVCL